MPDTDLKNLQQKWKDAPESGAFYPLAYAYFDIGLYDAAADVLQQGLRHHPTHVKGLTLLGQIQHARGDSDEARDIFNKALKSDPDSPDPLCGLAEIEIAAGNHSRAETWLKRAESLEVTPWVMKVREELDRKMDSTPAAESELPFVTETMVDLYLKQGMEEKAVAALRQLLVQNPDNPLLRQRLDELLHATVSAEKQEHRSKLDVAAHLNAWLRAVEQRKQRR